MRLSHWRTVKLMKLGIWTKTLSFQSWIRACLHVFFDMTLPSISTSHDFYLVLCWLKLEYAYSVTIPFAACSYLSFVCWFLQLHVLVSFTLRNWSCKNWSLGGNSPGWRQWPMSPRALALRPEIWINMKEKEINKINLKSIQ